MRYVLIAFSEMDFRPVASDELPLGVRKAKRTIGRGGTYDIRGCILSSF